MNPVWLATFFGLALAGVDIFGGFIAAAILARGLGTRALALFAASYAFCVVVAATALLPVMSWLDHLLSPFFAVRGMQLTLQVIAAIALVALGGWQLHAARRPPRPHRPVKTSAQWASLIAGGALLAATTAADPPFLLALGMAQGIPGWGIRLLLLTAWNALFNLPLLGLLIASAIGADQKLMEWAEDFVTPRRRPLLTLLAALLIASALLLLADSAWAAQTERAPALGHLLSL